MNNVDRFISVHIPARKQAVFLRMNKWRFKKLDNLLVQGVFFDETEEIAKQICQALEQQFGVVAGTYRQTGMSGLTEMSPQAYSRFMCCPRRYQPHYYTLERLYSNLLFLQERLEESISIKENIRKVKNFCRREDIENLDIIPRVA